jgi:PDZ domain-containing protein
VRQARRAIEAVPSGSRLSFVVTVDGEAQTIGLVRRPCGGSEDPLVGVSLINSFPFEVRMASGEIGGPSAGLMWALGLYDLLTPGDLTGGRIIAGTGMIGVDGSVQPIGSIDEKVIAAADAGATVLLVPEGNFEEANATDDRRLKIVPVGSLEDALAYLEGG